MTLMTIRLRALKPGANKPLSGAQNHGIHSRQLLNYGTEKKESREICELALREMKLSWHLGTRLSKNVANHSALSVVCQSRVQPRVVTQTLVTNSRDHWWYSLWLPCLSRFANAFGALKCRTRRLVLAGGSACTKHRWAATEPTWTNFFQQMTIWCLRSKSLLPQWIWCLYDMVTLLCESGRSAKVVVVQSSVLRRVGMYGHIHIILKDSKSNVCWTAVYCLLSTPNLGYVDLCGTILPDMVRLTGVSCESILCFRKASVFRPTLLSSQNFSTGSHHFLFWSWEMGTDLEALWPWRRPDFGTCTATRWRA